MKMPWGILNAAIAALLGINQSEPEKFSGKISGNGHGPRNPSSVLPKLVISDILTNHKNQNWKQDT